MRDIKAYPVTKIWNKCKFAKYIFLNPY